jgi:predicted glycoside hydrolase/deacetylase ChbG (UPF0249 family)
MKCRIVADDYGMSEEINNAISDLVHRGIVLKVSVMANKYLEYSINDFGGKAETGLHVNFTTGMKSSGAKNGGKSSLIKLLYLIFTRKLNIDFILDEVEQQYKEVENKGFKICHLDAHQHIHIIPKVLQSLIICARNKNIDSIRCITMELKYMPFYIISLMRSGFLRQVPKMIFLYSMGGVMKFKLNKAKINFSSNLILMPLATGGKYEELLKVLLNKFKNENAELVTHPGLETGSAMPDNYTDGRYIEYRSIVNNM